MLQQAQNNAATTTTTEDNEGATSIPLRTRDFLSTKPQYLLTSAVDTPIGSNTVDTSAPASESDTTSLQEERSTGTQHDDNTPIPTSTSNSIANVSALKSLILDLSQQLVASSDAQRIARLLPGQWTASHWMEGGAEAQRAVVLQLAAAAADPNAHELPTTIRDGGGVYPGNNMTRTVSGNGYGENEEEYRAAYEAMVSPRAAEFAAEGILPSPTRKKSESLPLGVEYASWTDLSSSDKSASLEQVLTLAQRCGVDEFDVQLAYMAAVIGRREDGSLQRAEGDLKKVWPAVLKSRPNDAAIIILRDVYPKLSSDRGDKLAWALNLCSEACRCVVGSTAAQHAQQAQQGDDKVPALEWVAAADALLGLSKGISAIQAFSTDSDAKVFIKPTVDLLINWLGSANDTAIPAQKLTSTANSKNSANDTGLNAEHDDAASALIGELLAHCDIDTVAVLASAVHALAANHNSLQTALQPTTKTLSSFALAAAFYPASSSTAYVAALCRELSRMAIAESLDRDQKQRLEALFKGTTVTDACATAAFACLGGPPPVVFPSEPPMVLLSPEQALAVLDAVFTAFDGNLVEAANAAGAGTSSERTSPRGRAVTAAVDSGKQLATERTRLALLLQLDKECADVMNEGQVAGIHAFIPRLLEASSSSSNQDNEISITSSSCVRLLRDHVAILLADGCPISAAFSFVKACRLIGPWASDEVVVQAAESAVRTALYALSREGGDANEEVPYVDFNAKNAGPKDSLSVGDAIQNLYGVIRSLDINDDAIFASSDTTATTDGSSDTNIEMPSRLELVQQARTAVWELLQQHAAQNASNINGNANAAAAEAHLQVLQMLGSLGTAMWQKWTPPPESATASAGKFKHTEALLHSRAAALLAGTWPTALRDACITPEDFSSSEVAETAVLKILDQASSVEQLTAVILLLSEVLEELFPPKSLLINNDNNLSEKGLSISGISLQGGFPPFLSSFHRAWANCLTALITQGALSPVIAALDAAAIKESEAERVLVAESEAEGIVQATDAALGVVAAATVALLLPYSKLQEREWERILHLQTGEDIRGLPGIVPLSIIALHRKRSVGLARHNPVVFKHLYRTLLQLDSPALCGIPAFSSSSGRESKGGAQVLLPTRTGLAVAAASHLVLDGNIQAAAWVAMQHAGTHPFLRILDSGNIVLSGLLRTGSGTGSAQGHSVQGEVEFDPGAMAVLQAGKCAEEILRGVPAIATAALQKLDL